MRKYGIALLAALAALSLTACNESGSQPPAPKAAATAAQGEKATPAPAPTKAPPTPEELAREKARKIIDGMTLEEKAAQMFLLRCPEAGGAELQKQYQFGAYILFARDFEGKTPEQVKADIKSYQESAKIPMLIGVDEEGGTVNRVSRFSAFRSAPFPAPQQLYRKGGLELVVSDAKEKSALLRSLGINLNLAPVCDMTENPGDFIYNRTLGKGAKETARYITQVVNAMKGEKMGAALKHFPGYGNNIDTHTGIAYDKRPYETFLKNDFLPFIAGIEAGAGSVLVSHNIVYSMDEEYPASLSKKVHEILRKELGFTGVIMTDDLAMGAIQQYLGGGSAAVLAVQAGNDLLCCDDYLNELPALINAVRAGEISQSRIDESVMRILLWKQELGAI